MNESDSGAHRAAYFAVIDTFYLQCTWLSAMKPGTWDDGEGEEGKEKRGGACCAACLPVIHTLYLQGIWRSAMKPGTWD